MLRPVRALVLLLTLVGLLLTAPAVSAQDEDTPPEWRITRYDARVDTDAGGTSSVTINFDFDFGNSPGHGPFVTLPQRQAVAGDPDVWRMVDITLREVSSPSGAPAEVATTTEDGTLVIRIGREGTRVRGVQSYTVAYTARGLIAPNQATSGLDELNWNAIGTGWQLPLNAVTVTASGPADVSRVACFSGAQFDVPCVAAANGASATYSVDSLQAREGMQIVAGFPAGTFTGAEPRYEKRYHVGNLVPVTPLTGGLTLGLSALGIAAVLVRSRRWSRDEVYLGLTPGLRPAPGQQGAVGVADRKAPVTVQFTPPAGAHPGEIGVLLDTRADNVDVTATILDLAARGHFQIVEDGKHWRFVQRRSSDPLTKPESHVLSVLFSQGSEVSTEALRDKEYHTLLSGARERLQKRVTKDLHWFKGSPQLAQAAAYLGGAGLVVLGVLLGLVLAFAFGFGLLGLAPVAAGVALLAIAHRAGRRTAEGSAVLAQSKGFELYLRTAEADQIKFEEGIDVFSRYLPYAVIFGVADRWAKLFEQLAREGRYTPTDWYVGYGVWDGMHFAAAMNGLSHQLSESMQHAVSAQTAATAGSSGGSGFSGGGGFGGGGGGGW
ncbi:MAG: DUF2207 domain-containing protein [Actinomycetes bacterium]